MGRREEETMQKEDDVSMGGWSNSHQMLVFLIKTQYASGELGLISSSSNSKNSELGI